MRTIPAGSESSRGQELEQFLEAALGGKLSLRANPEALIPWLEEFKAAHYRDLKVVAFGGGTGLSTVVGGNSQLPDWPGNPFVGLKQDFPHLDVVVCTTDDGGSTGLLLQQFPSIAIGDLRKLLLSLMRQENLHSAYPQLEDREIKQLVRMAHRLFNYRFAKEANDSRCLLEPLRLLPKTLSKACPESLAALFNMLGRRITPEGEGPTIKPGGHCLGNLFLVSALSLEAPDLERTPPPMPAIIKALNRLAVPLGVNPGRLYPATHTLGQLVLTYHDGVAVRGQSKAATSLRNFPIDRVAVEFSSPPAVSEDLLQVIRKADLIIYAPGSIYTSIIPILKLAPIVKAIKENKRALKILGANFWIQKGETDISQQSRKRGFFVSELIEAYHRNTPGGASGLFDVVLSANLEHIPGHILRNYLLEGKSPIYLDRIQVSRLGLLPIEATIYSRRQLLQRSIIKHAPEKFTLAVRALFFAHQRLNLKAKVDVLRERRPIAESAPENYSASPPSAYLRQAAEELTGKHFAPERLHRLMLEIIWENRDIRIDHLKSFRGVVMVPSHKWDRSNEWDNVLGYFDPRDGLLKIHERLDGDSVRLPGNILIALGESLLGRYLERRRWLETGNQDHWGARAYEIRLRPVQERECRLGDADLRTYLSLARMVENPKDDRTFRITLNDREGFLPPGLLFGLLYAWYFNNAYGEIMEYEMSLLHTPRHKLIPYQLEELNRKQALVAFFRRVVFEHA